MHLHLVGFLVTRVPRLFAAWLLVLFASSDTRRCWVAFSPYRRLNSMFSAGVLRSQIPPADGG